MAKGLNAQVVKSQVGVYFRGGLFPYLKLGWVFSETVLMSFFNHFEDQKIQLELFSSLRIKIWELKNARANTYSKSFNKTRTVKHEKVGDFGATNKYEYEHQQITSTWRKGANKMAGLKLKKGAKERWVVIKQPQMERVSSVERVSKRLEDKEMWLFTILVWQKILWQKPLICL